MQSDFERPFCFLHPPFKLASGQLCTCTGEFVRGTQWPDKIKNNEDSLNDCEVFILFPSSPFKFAI